ncbi:protein AaeX [Burkholderia multivorans]
MIGEIDIFGVFVPAPLVLMLIAYLINIVIGFVFTRVGLYRFVWHRSIFDLGIYVFVLAVVMIVSYHFMAVSP